LHGASIELELGVVLGEFSSFKTKSREKKSKAKLYPIAAVVTAKRYVALEFTKESPTSGHGVSGPRRKADAAPLSSKVSSL